MTRKRGPLDDLFEDGYVPTDEPPGIEEHEYRRWKEAGGKADGARSRARTDTRDLRELLSWLEYGRTGGYIAARQTQKQEHHWADLLRGLTGQRDGLLAALKQLIAEAGEEDAAAHCGCCPETPDGPARACGRCSALAAIAGAEAPSS